MPKIAYLPEKRFKPETMQIIELANEICTSYRLQGYNLTLRQLYYQFISRDFFPNSEKSYDRLGRIVSDARLVGLLDWSHLEDRGREAHGTGWVGHEVPSHRDLVRNARYGYSLDLWEGQERRVEVWVEKQALEEVVERAANQTRSAYFACKGYVSQSEMWAAGQRMRKYAIHGHAPLILHLGDHDPSGIDMTRDIEERLTMFAGRRVEVRRLALNRDQIDEYDPPPNPAKVTDSRFEAYSEIYGDESWELDALRPQVLVDLITREIERELDVDLFNAQLSEEEEGRAEFDRVAERWDDIVDFLNREEE